MRTIARDPFARHDLVSRRVYHPRTDGCRECGHQPTTPKGRPYLYQYGIDRDDRFYGGVSWGSHLFCSVSCARAHGEA